MNTDNTNSNPITTDGTFHAPTPPDPHLNPWSHDTVPLVPHKSQKILAARSDARLATLPLDDQEIIIEWLHAGIPFRKIIELAAKPPPEGLDLKISLGSLSRFNQKTRLAERIQDATRLVQEISPERAKTPEAAFEVLAQTHSLHAMAAPDLDHAAFQQISRYLLRQQEYKLRQRSLDLREKRLAFEMQHKHYDIFKRTIEKLPEINEIVRNQSLSPLEKFNQHFIKLFGRETFDMLEDANKKWKQAHPDEPHTGPDYSKEDVIPPLTPEEQQAANKEAVEVMMGWKPSYDT